MQTGQGLGVKVVSEGRSHAPHTLWLARIGPWRCLCKHRRVQCSHMRGFWEVSERG